MRVMLEKPKYLHAQTSGRAIGVDRKNSVLQGYVVAQLGPFKSDGRGEFDLPALHSIVRIGNASPQGLTSRFGHETMCDDSPGKHLGRSTNFTLSSAIDDRTGKTVPAARADLKFNKAALKPPPNGGTPYAEYVMDVAESDKGALSSSLVVSGVDFFLPDEKGNLVKVGPEEIPPSATPIWRPTSLRGSDIVCVGDAVDALLDANVKVDGLPLSVILQGQHQLDELFQGMEFEEIEKRLILWGNRYLQNSRGPNSESLLFKLACRIKNVTEAGEPLETPRLDKYRKALGRMAESVAS